MTLYRCGTCRDIEWVAVDASRNIVKPCPACNQAMFARWSTGEFGPDFKLRRASEDLPDARRAAESLTSCRDTLAGNKKQQGAA